MSPMNNTLVVLGGPTASGKTETGIRLAQYYESEIISADSRQIYREPVIGTAKPHPAQLAAVPHHFIGHISVKEYYNASLYETQVLELLNQLFQKNRLVFMAGGSGLYIDAVCSGIDDLPTIDPVIREKLWNTFREEGIESLQHMLEERDPESYRRIDLNNHYRVLKALEVCTQTGRPYSSFLSGKERERDFRVIRMALHLDRDLLYDRINRRVDHMISLGLVEEVRDLAHLRSFNAMKTVGYREIFRYLDGAYDLDEAIDHIRRNTRKYARKQITWFRKNNRYRWFDPSDTDAMIGYIETKRKDPDSGPEI